MSGEASDASASNHDEGSFSQVEEKWQTKPRHKTPEPIKEETENNNTHTSNTSNNKESVSFSGRKRLPRACTARSSSRLYTSAPAVVDRKPPSKREKITVQEQPQQQCSKIITPLLNDPPPSQLLRWNLRSMWELASLLNFLHIFRPLLNITVEFSAEELETALITPNSTLDDIHIPLLKPTRDTCNMLMRSDNWPAPGHLEGVEGEDSKHFLGQEFINLDIFIV